LDEEMNTRQPVFFGGKSLNIAVIVLLMFTIFTTFQSAHAAGMIRHAIPGAASSGSCDSWGNACDLPYALISVAVAGDQILVKGGVYKPGGVSDLRTATFQLKSGVALYGGFPPSGDPEFGARETACVSKIISFTGRGEHETLGEF